MASEAAGDVIASHAPTADGVSSQVPEVQTTRSTRTQPSQHNSIDQDDPPEEIESQPNAILATTARTDLPLPAQRDISQSYRRYLSILDLPVVIRLLIYEHVFELVKAHIQIDRHGTLTVFEIPYVYGILQTCKTCYLEGIVLYRRHRRIGIDLYRKYGLKRIRECPVAHQATQIEVELDKVNDPMWCEKCFRTLFPSLVTVTLRVHEEISISLEDFAQLRHEGSLSDFARVSRHLDTLLSSINSLRAMTLHNLEVRLAITLRAASHVSAGMNTHEQTSLYPWGQHNPDGLRMDCIYDPYDEVLVRMIERPLDTRYDVPMPTNFWKIPSSNRIRPIQAQARAHEREKARHRIADAADNALRHLPICSAAMWQPMPKMLPAPRRWRVTPDMNSMEKAAAHVLDLIETKPPPCVVKSQSSMLKGFCFLLCIFLSATLPTRFFRSTLSIAEQKGGKDFADLWMYMDLIIAVRMAIWLFVLGCRCVDWRFFGWTDEEVGILWRYWRFYLA